MYKQYLTCPEAPPVPPYDAVLDKRLVRTSLATIEVIITFRDRANGLLLSELGGYLETPDKAPAGTKRRSRLVALFQVGGLAHRSLSLAASQPAVGEMDAGRRGGLGHLG